MVQVALSHLRITDSAEVPLLLQYLAASREAFERLTGRVFLASTFELSVNEWPKNGALPLGRAPIESIDSITYLDENGLERIVSDSLYTLATPEDDTGYCVLRDAFTYPALSDRVDAIKVNFTAGHDSWADVPATQRQAVLFLAAHFYELRTPINVGNSVNDIPMTLTSLITMNRIGGFIG